MIDKKKYPRYFVCLTPYILFSTKTIFYVFFRKHNSQARIVYKDGQIKILKFYLSSVLHYYVKNGYYKEVLKEELALII